VTQSKKFDPDGAYLRRWLPELADLSVDLVHEPWKDDAARKRSGYPMPIVELGASRQDALNAFQSLRKP